MYYDTKEIKCCNCGKHYETDRYSDGYSSNYSVCPKCGTVNKEVL